MKENNNTDQYQEWVEHQYNPGYWQGRFRLGFPAKRTKGMWLFSFIDLFVSVLTFFLFLIAYLFEKSSWYLMGMAIFGPFSILSILRTRGLKPVDQPPTQEEIEDLRRKEKRSKNAEMPTAARIFTNIHY